jgi:hypothetical protein
MSSGIHPRFSLKNLYSCIQCQYHVPIFNFVGNSHLLHNYHISNILGVLYCTFTWHRKDHKER